jgi:hypothetical protein
MKIHLLVVVLISLANEKTALSQPVIGVWKGTSICQIKNSPCHDETNLYHISTGSVADQYRIDANKIVDGKEVEMGTLYYMYDPQQHLLVCVDSAHNARWQFKITGKEMHGTLMVKDKLFRLIELKRKE